MEIWTKLFLLDIGTWLLLTGVVTWLMFTLVDFILGDKEYDEYYKFKIDEDD